MKIDKAEKLNGQFEGEMEHKMKEVMEHNSELEKEIVSLKEFKNLKNQNDELENQITQLSKELKQNDELEK